MATGVSVYKIKLPKTPNGKIDFSSNNNSVQLYKHLKQALLNNDEDIILTTTNVDEFEGPPDEATLKFDEDVALRILFDYTTETIYRLQYRYGPSRFGTDENIKYYIMNPFTYKIIFIGDIKIYFKNKIGVIISRRSRYWWPEYTEKTPLDALRRLKLRF